MKSTKIALAVLALAIACPMQAARPLDLTEYRTVTVDYVPTPRPPKAVKHWFWFWFVPYLP